MAQDSLEQAFALLDSGRTEEGVLMVRQIASQGNPDALFMLAEMTWSGTLVPQDPPRGRLLFEYASSFGHREAGPLVTNLLADIGVALLNPKARS